MFITSRIITQSLAADGIPHDSPPCGIRKKWSSTSADHFNSDFNERPGHSKRTASELIDVLPYHLKYIPLSESPPIVVSKARK